MWLGVADESAEERAARLDAARDILAEEPELYDRVTAIVAKGLPCVPVLSARSAVSSAEALLGGEAA
ncbi:hypothetical protein IHE61_07100 [Streptomyces sp. GKU 257-1]|nr:hypothetical protein [Streptomyces sp. GKU 257-1]